MSRTVTTPVVVRTRGELAKGLAALRRPQSATVAFVPTMGALHDGHRALLQQARELGDVVVLSIFVNPLQFGSGEDLDTYPRTLDADLIVAQEEGVDLVFAPTEQVMYPEGRSGQAITVSAGEQGTRFEGAARPGHFDGVLTVVAKLFNLVGPDVAVFGEKDAQQLALIRRMVGDLDLPVHIVGVPTVREPDGLALSSRNAYLDTDGREQALVLSRALYAGAAAATDGPAAVLAAARAELSGEPRVLLDYLALVAADSFQPVTRDHSGAAVLMVAAEVCGVRLLDNVPIVL
jgi:pantoate--beta-alanine ligase